MNWIDYAALGFGATSGALTVFVLARVMSRELIEAYLLYVLLLGCGAGMCAGVQMWGYGQLYSITGDIAVYPPTAEPAETVRKK